MNILCIKKILIAVGMTVVGLQTAQAQIFINDPVTQAWIKEQRARAAAEAARAAAAAKLKAARDKVLAKTTLIPVPETEIKTETSNLRLVRISVDVSCQSSWPKHANSTEVTTNCRVSPILFLFEGVDGKIHHFYPKVNELGGLVLDFGKESILVGRLKPSDWTLIQEAKQRLADSTSKQDNNPKNDSDSTTVELNPDLQSDFLLQIGQVAKTTYARKIQWEGMNPIQSIVKNTQNYQVWICTAGGRTVTQEFLHPKKVVRPARISDWYW